eukprot:TRINITY_DN26335_c0_g1_i1.p1 TRINITY_DN26335_c0_g1~~TRINITY_DN26335_c0_g1_i1.p1  ORF type:complete len:428 (-),score=78.20 TRINITY_DN26335_c0_g1_i1:75-1295(-)
MVVILDMMGPQPQLPPSTTGGYNGGFDVPGSRYKKADASSTTSSKRLTFSEDSPKKLGGGSASAKTQAGIIRPTWEFEASAVSASRSEQSDLLSGEFAELPQRRAVRAMPGVLDVHGLIGMGPNSTYVFDCTIEDPDSSVAASAAGNTGLGARAARLRPTLSIKRKRVAVKVFMEDKRDSERESKLMRSVQHPNLVRLHKVVEGPPSAIFMELCTGGSLHSLIRSHGAAWARQSARQRLRPAECVVAAVEYLHSMDILHRDIKTTNCLLASPCGIGDSSVNVKLGDLGSARVASSSMTRGVGSVHAMAPEVFLSGTYSCSADIFSLAILLFEVFSGQEPYRSLNLNTATLAIAIADGRRPAVDAPVFQDAHPDLTTLMQESWAQDAHARPSTASFQARLAAITHSA